MSVELRFGLLEESDHKESPVKNSRGKRGFLETTKVDLKLNLSPTNDFVSSSSTIAYVAKNKDKDGGGEERK